MTDRLKLFTNFYDPLSSIQSNGRIIWAEECRMNCLSVEFLSEFCDKNEQWTLEKFVLLFRWTIALEVVRSNSVEKIVGQSSSLVKLASSIIWSVNWTGLIRVRRKRNLNSKLNDGMNDENVLKISRSNVFGRNKIFCFSLWLKKRVFRRWRRRKGKRASVVRSRSDCRCDEEI